MLAARQGHDAACRSLVDDLGADCNLTDEDGATATHHAAAHGRADALAVLPPVADALHVAAANNSRDVIERLVDGGASPNARDGRNATAAHWAADYDEVAALKKLQSLGASLVAQDGQGRFPVDVADRANSTGAAAWLRQQPEVREVLNVLGAARSSRRRPPPTPPPARSPEAALKSVFDSAAQTSTRLSPSKQRAERSKRRPRGCSASTARPFPAL